MRASTIKPALLALVCGWLLPAWPAAAQTSTRAVPEDELPPVRAVRAAGLKAEVAALVMSGQEGGDVPVEVLALPVRTEGDKVRVPLLIEAGGEELAAGHVEGPLRFEIYAYALTADGALRDSLIQTYEADLGRVGDRLGDSGVKFTGDLDLLPGEYSLRVLVRNGAGKVGMRVLPLSVPAADGPPALLRPLLDEPAGAWLEVREARERDAEARPGVALLASGPAAKPVLVQGEEVTLRLPAVNLNAVGSELVVEVVGGGGQSVELPARVSAASAESEGSLRILTAAFEPAGLMDGDYQLRVVAKNGDGAGELLRSPLVPVRVVGADNAGRVWAAVTANTLAAASATAAVQPAPQAKLRKKDAGPIIAGYAEVLQTLSQEGEAQARVQMFNFADALSRDKGVAGLEILARAEANAARGLARVDPDALVPVMMLHHWLYQEALGRRNMLLSTHARTTTLAMADLYLDSGMSVAAKQQAAGVFSSLGAVLQSSRMARMSNEVFRRTLAIDSDNEVALLALAFNHERAGEYELALGYLETLLDADPGHGEARLRLAVNLERLGRNKAAKRHLAELVEGRHRSWVLSLAYQKLAAFHIEERQLEEAESLLRAGVERLPGVEKLYLQLAFVYDALVEPDKAQATLDEMSRRADRSGSSARHRYTQWPSDAVTATRRGLRLAASERQPALASALARSDWPGEGS